jgi:Group II intron, maturase-specific domain
VQERPGRLVAQPELALQGLGLRLSERKTKLVTAYQGVDFLGYRLRAVVSRLDRYLRGWGEYFKRAQVAGVFDRYDRWILRRLRAFVAKRWRNGLWRRYPDRYFWVHVGLTRLYRLTSGLSPRTRGPAPCRQPTCRA